ncbi:hypothetical protein AB0N06_13730 [Streptomyces sp. NPDC051020]
MAKQSSSLPAHRFFDQGELLHLRKPEGLAKPIGLDLDAALAAGLLT